MENNTWKTKGSITKLKKLSLICFFLISILSVNTLLASTYALQKNFTFTCEQKTIQEVFNYLEENSEFVFLYYAEILDTNRKVSLSVKNETIQGVLNKLLVNTSVNYKIKDRQVVLHKKGETPAPAPVVQQQKIVTGKVVDAAGDPLPGVAILVVGNTRGVTTDMDGAFSIEVKDTDKLMFTYLGMEDQTVEVKGKKTLNVVMKEKADMLEEVTVVAFAKQKKASVIASVSTIRPSDLKVPSSNLTTSLAGRIAGVISYQRSGEPGQDDADFFVRGVTTFGTGKANPLILIDGVEFSSRDLARLTPDDIASFSIMKDANATALYGARGANGVILVTTKEGQEGKAKLSIRVENTISQPIKQVELADPITYMKLHNEAVKTRDPLGAIPYSNEKIAMTGVGNPNVYPAVDWQNMLFKNATNNTRVNLNLSGGGKVARYYAAAAYNTDNGILKVDKRNNFNSNIKLTKYVLRTNVNVNVTSTTEAIFRLHGTFDEYNGPLEGGSDIYRKVMRTNPVLFPPYYTPDAAHGQTQHILFGNAGKGTYLNPYADMVKGYKDYSETQIMAQVELKQNLDFITEGLSVRGLFNTSRYSYFDVSRSYSPYFYGVSSYDRKTDIYTLEALNANSGTEYLGYSEGDKKVSSSLYFEGVAKYDRTFNEKHAVSALMVFTAREAIAGNAGDIQRSLPSRNLGLAGRATYGYDSRYMVEFNFGYNGSERFSRNERFGFFPSAGVGYLISNEAFFKPLKPIIPTLKLKATYGLSGSDNIGESHERFFYLSDVNMDNGGKGAYFGTDFGYGTSGISISRYANPYISWETAYKQNYGIELNLFNKLDVQADYFVESRKNILMERSYIPSSMGLQVATKSNVGESTGSGIDISLDYSESFSNDFWLSVRGNFTYALGKFKVYEEPEYANTPWLRHKGQYLSQRWGLIAERLFVDESDVSNSPRQTFGEYAAGDIKYRDINNDGVIDGQDNVPIGFPQTPEIIYGVGFSLGYKGLDFSAFFQGSARSSFWIEPSEIAPFVGMQGVSQNALMQVIADDHWSEDSRNPRAFWPRLADHAINNNQQTSTWWMRDGSFIRLKSMEFGYTIPDHILRKIMMKGLRVYVSGTNLFTLSKFKLWDPEMAHRGLDYPVQRVFNVGLNLTF